LVTFGVRTMRSGDTAAASRISAEAGARFAEVDEPRIAACADDEPFTADELEGYVAAGRAWVATEDDDVVGFVIVDLLDGAAHIEEIDVALDASARGHGTRLLSAVTDWATTIRAPAVTLTTFRDVPWNRPWYERRGFRTLTDDELTPELAARRAAEDAEGLPAELRVVMRLALR
jgi:GNAT superfamily N-acetyltransferase